MTETAISPVFIVTGASRGIGHAIVQELRRRGARVLGAARNPDTSSSILVKGSTGNCHYLQADISIESDRLRIIEKAKDLFGRIDGLINNAGHAIRTPASKTSLDDFRALLEINLLAAFSLAQAAYEELRATRGTLVNISSVTGQVVLPNRLAYGTTKAALDHITRSLAVEWGPDGIRVNGVLPWFTRTEMVKSALEDQEFESRLIAATPLGRLAEPDDVARVVAFLALPDSAYVTGQLIAVDGGYLAQGL
ncbi:MAG: SDR family oxidoreductase [Verrucomicrobia bacterium]|nr:SDR family oxidoreductase [Verrucomicrobiota bacterium]MBV8417595.1 SDR family oxidoreductase [Verrucomicrobiota bacterium]